MRRPLSILIALALLASLPGCDALQAVQPFATPVPPTATMPAPTLAIPPTTTPAPPSAAETPAGPEQIVLTVWVPETLAPTSETPGGQQLLEQLAAFDDLYPDIRAEVYVKLTSGPGSTLSYLYSAPGVAPAILPDLVLLDRSALAQAARDDLIVPIGTLIDPALLSDVYDAALALGTVDNQLAGLPYVLQVSHVVYRDTLFEQPPNSFEVVARSPVPFVFPAGTRGSVSETLLMQYMQAAGSLVDEDGMPRIDPVALTDVLAFYADARAAGVIDPALFQITDLSESWTQYASRQAGLAVVSSTLYLSGRDQVRSTGVTWIPTLSGDPYALASGWSWAVTTRAAERQAAAMALVNFLMNPINQGAFTQAAGWLPSQAGALAVWGDSDPYTAFGDTMLRSAVPFPEAGPRAVIGAAIQDALEAVLLNGVTPFQAAAEAAQKVNPPVEEP